MKKTKLEYLPAHASGIEFIRLSFKPSVIKINGKAISETNHLVKEGYTLKALGNGDYSLVIRRSGAGRVTID